MAVAPFDRSVLKVGQVLLVTGLVAAWAISLAGPPAAIALPLYAAMMLGAAAGPATSLPRALYVGVLTPRGLVRPRVRVEDAAPHRFAQLVGAAFLTAASIVALVGMAAVAWTLAWIVVVLACLNFAIDLCVGCIVYAWLVRLGVLPLGSRRPAVSG